MAARHPVRLLANKLQPQRSVPRQWRPFSSTSTAFSAHNFTMPAMSPTMTEGNISSWKVKEGDSFSTGDVLLEIETDKATMDVEAQDDGVVAKIFTDEGSKGVKVGTRIAVLADAGDDISSLEIPKDDSKPVESPADNVGKTEGSKYESSGSEKEIPGTPQNKRPSRDRPKTSPKGAGQNPKYPLYPSVIALVHENHLSDEDVAKIPATGPNNRLLKGDVLSYLGTIESDYSSQQSKRIANMSHLDLSNIKIAPPAPKAETSAQPDKAGAPSPSQVASVSIPISLSEVLKVQKRIQETLGVSVSLSTFLARAVDLANDDLPRLKTAKPSSTELFNAVLGLDSIPTTSRGTYLPQIDALPPPASSSRPSHSTSRTPKKPDIIEILSGRVMPKRAALPISLGSGSTITTSSGAINMFTLTVPQGEEKRARTFLERMKTVLQIEPGKLVL